MRTKLPIDERKSTFADLIGGSRNFEKEVEVEGRRQCICTVVIYRECAYAFYAGKGDFLRKKMLKPIGGAPTVPRHWLT